MYQYHLNFTCFMFQYFNTENDEIQEVTSMQNEWGQGFYKVEFTSVIDAANGFGNVSND